MSSSAINESHEDKCSKSGTKAGRVVTGKIIIPIRCFSPLAYIIVYPMEKMFNVQFANLSRQMSCDIHQCKCVVLGETTSTIYRHTELFLDPETMLHFAVLVRHRLWRIAIQTIKSKKRENKVTRSNFLWCPSRFSDCKFRVRLPKIREAKTFAVSMSLEQGSTQLSVLGADVGIYRLRVR